MTATWPQEQELKLALGGAAEYALWRRQLGQPDEVQEQLNFYLRSPQIEELKRQGAVASTMMRVRSLCPTTCLRCGSVCDLAADLIACPDLTAGLRLLASLGWQNKRYIFTLKQGGSDGAGYFQSTELEAELTPEQLVRILRGDLTALTATCPGEYLQSLDAKTCSYLGFLHNTRCRYRRPEGEVWELDLSRFPHHDDCEIEVETAQPQRAFNQITALADILGTPWRAQHLTKLERFLADLQDSAL